MAGRPRSYEQVYSQSVKHWGGGGTGRKPKGRTTGGEGTGGALQRGWGGVCGGVPGKLADTPEDFVQDASLRKNKAFLGGKKKEPDHRKILHAVTRCTGRIHWVKTKN